MVSEPTFLEAPCPRAFREQGESDGAVSHVNAVSLCKKYFYSAYVKDEGARRKLFHYLVVDKRDEKIEVAE